MYIKKMTRLTVFPVLSSVWTIFTL